VDLNAVTAVDQAWATDITYIPLQKGFLYLVAVMDLFSRNVLSWKLSNSLDTEFCLDALEMALGGGRRPEIFHSDQGCQFTSGDFVARLQAEEIRISWSGRKRCYDNILVERLWRTVKYEEVYLRAYSDGWETEISLARFLWRYCHVGTPEKRFASLGQAQKLTEGGGRLKSRSCSNRKFATLKLADFPERHQERAKT
jgi:putative transposase